MARLQIAGEDNAGALTIHKTPTTVLVRPSWELPWMVAPYLEAIRSEEATAPTIGIATLLWNVGRIKQHDRTTKSTYYPLDIQGWYVRILVHTRTGTFVSFTGVVLAEEQGKIAVRNGAPYQDQTIECGGLEVMLKRGRVQGSYTAGDAADIFIERTMVFNQRNELGLGLSGNRSTARNADGVHRFSADGAVWTHRDILEYLMWFYHPGEVPFYLTGRVDVLDQMVGRYDFAGKELYQIIEQLVDRRRGLGWKVVVESDAAYIEIFSVSAEPISFGEFYLPANGTQAVVSLLPRPDMETTLQIVRAHTVSRVIAIGGAVKVMLSVALSNGTLERGWSDAQETAYNAAEDDDRTTDKYKRVYTTYRVPRTWNWQYASLFDDSPQIANPGHTSDGELLPEVQGAYYNLDKRFERDLPLIEDTGDPDGERAYRPPFVLVQDPDDASRYLYVDRLSAIDLGDKSVSVVRNEMALRMRGGLNHTLALGTFDEADPAPASTRKAPEVDYRTIIATVFIETDTHAKVVYEIAGNQSNPVGRDLVILRPHAEVWWAAPGTVVDVNDGALVFQNGGAGELLRDDTSELRALAGAAAAWYSQWRNLFRMEQRGIAQSFPLGSLVRAASNTAYSYVPVGTTVTRKAYHYRRNEMFIQTGYQELEVEYLQQ